ncbi:hypothetical protein ACQPXH_26815 [Nocardia sp. CA-135953]|uniref:hypothetical protein n=1 Tax=Nocardia sp. CA-135953 TaxID=3239978 RepID=UPI003D95E40A
MMRKLGAPTALLIAALSITASPAQAAPSEGVGFTARATESSTIITTDAGSMAVEDGALKIKAADGSVVAGAELRFRVDDFEFPIAANIADHTATLTPQFDLAHATYKPVALPYEDKAPLTAPVSADPATRSIAHPGARQTRLRHVGTCARRCRG